MQGLRNRAVLITVLAATTAYAVLRYNVLKGVEWEHVPLYVLNKSLAWSAVVLWALGAWQALKTRSDLLASARVAEGSALAGVHVLMSLVLLGPERYPLLFGPARQLTGAAEVSLLAGVVAAACLSGARRSVGLVVVFSVAALVHATILGVRNWIAPTTWPGYLVPITLWSALAALVCAVLAMVWARRR